MIRFQSIFDSWCMISALSHAVHLTLCPLYGQRGPITNALLKIMIVLSDLLELKRYTQIGDAIVNNLVCFVSVLLLLGIEQSLRCLVSELDIIMFCSMFRSVFLACSNFLILVNSHCLRILCIGR